jgi:hypothetical protein
MHAYRESVGCLNCSAVHLLCSPESCGVTCSVWPCCARKDVVVGEGGGAGAKGGPGAAQCRGLF